MLNGVLEGVLEGRGDQLQEGYGCVSLLACLPAVVVSSRLARSASLRNRMFLARARRTAGSHREAARDSLF